MIYNYDISIKTYQMNCFTLITCSFGSRLQSAKVRRSPSRNFLLETVMVSLELWSISSGSGAFRYSSRRLNSRSRFFSWTAELDTQRDNQRWHKHILNEALWLSFWVLCNSTSVHFLDQYHRVNLLCYK